MLDLDLGLMLTRRGPTRDRRSRQEGQRRMPRPAVASGQRGATAVEYALIIASIAAVVVLAVTALGSTVIDLFESVVGRF
jgi:Flp pilus assembly pilin Flp